MSKIIFNFSIVLSLLLFCLFISTASSIAQGIDPWTNLNIYGGQINDIAIDPCNALKMFTGSYLGGGLFITEDGGKNWKGVLTGHEGSGLETQEVFRNTILRAIKIASPPHNNVIWVAHDLCVKKSTDGGQTWTHIENDTMQRNCPNCGGVDDDRRMCRALAIHPSDPQIVYVGTTGPTSDKYYFYRNAAIYKTEDGGSNWTKSTLPLDPDYNTVFAVLDLAIHPAAPDVVWALTYGSLYQSEDGGNSWSWIKNWADTSNTCNDIEIKPNDPNEIFIASYDGVLKVYFDQNSNQWQSASIAPSSRNVRALAFDPRNPEVLYAAWRNALNDNRPIVARSANGGVDWEENPIDYQFKTLAVHPTDTEVIFGGEFDLGLYKSTDHGKTWTPLNHGINAVRVYDIDINPKDKSHMLAATSVGVYEAKSDRDWSPISNFEYITAYAIAFHPTIDQTYYAGIRSQLAKSTDGGVNWTLSNKLDETDLSNNVSDIAIHSTNTEIQTTVVFVSVHGSNGRYGEVYRSADGGDTFERVLEGENKGGEKYSFNTVRFDPSDPNHIFAGGGNFPAPEIYGDLWESTNGGDSWDRTGLQDEIINSLLIDPVNPDIIYAGCGYGSGTFTPLYKSINGGETFTPSFLGMRELLVPLYGVWGDSTNNIFIIGEYGDILYYDHTVSLMISNTRKTLRDIWGASQSDIFAVGNEGIILHYDGVWSEMESWNMEDLFGIWGTSPTDIFAVGSNGTILNYDGAWSAMNSGTTENLFGIWGTSPADVFTVGSNGTILHYDGAWSAMESDTTENLFGIWGTSPTDIFAAGSNGTILHYDGAWSAMDSNTTVSLSEVWGSSPTDVFVAGSENTILHYNGNSWIKRVIGVPGEDLLDIWGFSDSDVIVTGNKGGIFHYDGNDWDIIRRWGSARNSVVDLEFHPQDKNIIFAGTSGTGIFASMDQSENWLYFGKPDYLVFAIATSSLYAGTEGGLWQCTGTGIITGKVRDPNSCPVDNALIFNEWVRTRSVNGEYILVSPAGICDVAAIVDDYIYKLARDIIVYGGDVTRVDFGIQRGIPNLLPGSDYDGDQDVKGKICFIGTAARF